MIESMSGYGQKSFSSEDVYIDIEIKSLNNKYIDISININNNFRFLEMEMRNIIKDALLRGSVYVNISITTSKTLVKPRLNKELLMESINILNEIQKESGTLDDIKIDHIMNFKDIITYEDNKISDNNINATILNVLKETIEDVKHMRVIEGKKTEEILKTLIEEISSINKYIKNNAQKLPEITYEKLKKRLESFHVDMDEGRLMQEVALIADRCDIREEIDRINSHINQFRNIMKEYPCGKKLDFLTQELLREFNTISSKVEDIEIKSKVILAKSNIDRIREQVQNIV
jgi:uncharacterized protein (TIGR00255 family)